MPEIVARRVVASDDGTHAHIDLVGYHTPHIPYEPLMISVDRLIEKTAVMERFWVTRDGEEVEVKAGTCPTCGRAPTLVTDRDPPGGSLILELAEG